MVVEITGAAAVVAIELLRIVGHLDEVGIDHCPPQQEVGTRIKETVIVMSLEVDGVVVQITGVADHLPDRLQQILGAPYPVLDPAHDRAVSQVIAAGVRGLLRGTSGIEQQVVTGAIEVVEEALRRLTVHPVQGVAGRLLHQARGADTLDPQVALGRPGDAESDVDPLDLALLLTPGRPFETPDSAQLENSSVVALHAIVVVG